MALDVLVTGGAGVLGQQIVGDFRSAGHHVWACGRVAAANVDLVWDLSKADEPTPEGNPNVVVHAAARVGSYQQPLAEAGPLFDVNVAGTLRVVDWCIQRRVPQLILISGAIVYGEWTGAPKTEADPVKPWVAGPYAVSKWCGEQVTHLLADSGVELIILRLSSLYGVGYSRGLIQRFLSQCNRGGSINLSPPFDDGFDLLNVSDAARTVRNAAGQGSPSAGSKVYNIGSGGVTTISELAEICAQQSGATVVYSDAENARPARIINWVDDERARRDLGHQPTTTLDSGIHDIAQSLPE